MDSNQSDCFARFNPMDSHEPDCCFARFNPKDSNKSDRYSISNNVDIETFI